MSKSTFSPAQIAAVKEINIVDYLHLMGFKETHTANNKKDYFFDLSNNGKKSGETHVDNRKNIFFSFDADKGGDIIQLVQQLKNCSFVDAVKQLSSNAPVVAMVDQVATPAKLDQRETKNITELKQASKINILTEYAQQRHISKDTLLNSSVQFLSQDVITNNELKNYFFIGLKNDSNGFSVRNKGMKGMRGNTDITTISKSNDKPYIVVEGLFEYLSVLQATKQFDLNFIILNSTVNSRKAADRINSIDGRFLLLLNNDDAGNKAASQILTLCPNKEISNAKFLLANDLNAAIDSQNGCDQITTLINEFQKKNSTVFNSTLNTTVMSKKTKELEQAQNKQSTDHTVQPVVAAETTTSTATPNDSPDLLIKESLLENLKQVLPEQDAAALFNNWKDLSQKELTAVYEKSYANVGTLVEHGKANFNFKPEEKENYYVKLNDLNGKEKVLWGLDFERAFAESKAKVGDTVSFEFLGKKDITIQIPVKDAEGKVVDSKPFKTSRNAWNINSDTAKIVADAKTLSSLIDIAKNNIPVETKNQSTQQGDRKTALTKDVRREIFDHYLRENGAAGKSYDDILAQYDKLKKDNPKKNRAEFGFLDQLVHRGFSDVIEIVYLVINKIKDEAGKDATEKKAVEGQGRIKMDIVRNAKGEYEVVEMPIVKRREAKKPKDNYLAMINYKATNEEIERIYDKKSTVLCGNEGNKYYVRFDPDTNNLILRNQKSLSMEYVPKEMMGVTLSDQNRKDLYDGKSITLDITDYKTKDNKVLNGKGTFEYSPIEHRFVMDRYYSNETLENFKQRETNLLQNLEQKQDKRQNIINEKEVAKGEEQAKDAGGVGLSQ